LKPAGDKISFLSERGGLKDSLDGLLRRPF
jgi:hypothetical protein